MASDPGTELARQHEMGMAGVGRHEDISIGTIIPSPMLEVLLNRAARFPRSEQTALHAALEELRATPGLAQKAFYSIPYEDSASGKKVPVEGLSIGAAMAIARRWGNIVTGGLVLAEDEAGWDIMGITFDLESNTYNSRPGRASKFYKPRGSNSMVPLKGLHKDNALRSGISKAIRTTVLWSLPEWFKTQYFNLAKELVANPPVANGQKAKPIEERLRDARGLFRKKWNVTDDEMDEYIANLSNVDTPQDLLTHLKGLYNAFEEKGADPNVTFGREAPPPAMPTEKAPPIAS